MSKLFTFLILCFVTLHGFSQKAVFSEISNLHAQHREFRTVDLLHFQTQDIQNRELKLNDLKKGTILSLDRNAIESLFQHQQDFISIPVPVTNRNNIVLTLQRHDIFTPDFKLYTSSDRNHPVDYKPGLHYQGIVEGDPNSVVAVSVFHDQIMALIAVDEGNFVIGSIKGDQDNQHIFYNDRDLVEGFSFTCETSEDGLAYTKDQLKALPANRDVNDCVRIYIEINDDIVTAKGGAVPATNYITAIFNQSFVLYANEQLNLTISEILAWTTPSPYTGNDSGANLSLYRQYTQWFNGDLSHLITYDSLYGVASSIVGVCNSNPDLLKCVSGISNHYENVPIFSWPVDMVTHEMGHLLGSNHTHACAWNGNGTSIDACGYNGDSPCPGPDPQIPVNGGTIMSYCTPGRGYYINLNEGFGPQPGNLIRSKVNTTGNCLFPCGEAPLYCFSYGISSYHKYIDKVTLNTINNTNGDNLGYGNFLSQNTTLVAGNQYTITLKPGFNSNTKFWRVWIDYNGDDDFEDAGEQVVQASGSAQLNANFTVPAGTSAVSTRMRVSMAYGAYVLPCESFASGEVEDYTINIQTTSGATCSDGIQNQGETGVDCGGPCPACPSAPTCNDGIQNQGETGIDCGGPCPACPEGDSTILLGAYFESGWDTWIDGGSDAARVNSSNSFEGAYSIKLSDNVGEQSSMTSPTFNLSTATGAKIQFHFKASSMENGDDFWVQYKNGSGSWTTIASFVAGTDFVNGNFYSANVLVPGFIPTSSGTFRIQCDAGENNDQVFIDAVIITKLNGIELNENYVIIKQISKPVSDIFPEDTADVKLSLSVYPNPAKDILLISMNGEIQSIRLLSLSGQVLKVDEVSKVNKQINIESLAPGVYFLQIESKGQWYPARFIKL